MPGDGAAIRFEIFRGDGQGGEYVGVRTSDIPEGPESIKKYV